jgi:hypothetical protein
MFAHIKKLFSPGEVDVFRSQQVSGVGAETVLKALGPIIEQRTAALMQELIHCPPILENLLDCRAKIGELIRIQYELKDVASLGKEAGEALQEIFKG